MIVRELVDKLWPSGEVSVLLASSARGLTASIVHVLRHRRFVGSADQYEGVQGDPHRAYTNMGRAQLKLVHWLEIQPFGEPHAGNIDRSLHRFAANSILPYAEKTNELLFKNPHVLVVQAARGLALRLPGNVSIEGARGL